MIAGEVGMGRDLELGFEGNGKVDTKPESFKMTTSMVQASGLKSVGCWAFLQRTEILNG